MRHSQPRRGSYLILLALVLTVVLGFAALLLDLAVARHAKVEMENGADAVALAGAIALDGTQGGMARAAQAGQQLAEANTILGYPLVGEGSRIGPWIRMETGAWDEEAGAFSLSADPEEVDAVRVFGAWDRPGLLPDRFDPIRISTTRVAARLARGAGAVDCYLPLAVPSCVLAAGPTFLSLRGSGTNRVAWGAPGGNPSTPFLRDQIASCEQDGEVQVGDEAGLSGGVQDTVLADLVGAIAGSNTRWDLSRWGALPAQGSRSALAERDYGRTLESALLVFEDDSACQGSGGVRTSQGVEVAGFAWVAIYDVQTQGTAAQKGFSLVIDPTRGADVGTRSGGPNYGVVWTKAALVQ